MKMTYENSDLKISKARALRLAFGFTVGVVGGIVGSTCGSSENSSDITVDPATPIVDYCTINDVVNTGETCRCNEEEICTEGYFCSDVSLEGRAEPRCLWFEEYTTMIDKLEPYENR